MEPTTRGRDDTHRLSRGKTHCLSEVPGLIRRNVTEHREVFQAGLGMKTRTAARMIALRPAQSTRLVRMAIRFLVILYRRNRFYKPWKKFR